MVRTQKFKGPLSSTCQADLVLWYQIWRHRKSSNFLYCILQHHSLFSLNEFNISSRKISNFYCLLNSDLNFESIIIIIKCQMFCLTVISVVAKMLKIDICCKVRKTNSLFHHALPKITIEFP